MAGLGTSLAEVIGGRSVTSLNKALGVTTCEDLLWLMPRRYQDMATLSDTGSLRVGDIGSSFGYGSTGLAVDPRGLGLYR